MRLFTLSRISVLVAALAVAPAVTSARPFAPAASPAAPAPQAFDIFRRFDANDLDLWTTNFGSLAWNLETGNAGLEYPRGSGKAVMFAAGLWVGAQVGGQKRVTVAEYSQEWAPGRILAGLPEDVNGPGLQSWKVVPAAGLVSADDSAFAASFEGDPVRHHGWGAYVAEGGAVGAPVGTRRLPVFGNPADSVDVPGPDLPGRLALWSVFNDADPAYHTNDAGASPPLGLEVRQAVFGFGAELPGVAFVRWTLVHRGSEPLDSAYVGFWADPDIGAPGDDLVGWNGGHDLAYAYNGQAIDAVYGSAPAAGGVLFLGGPAGVGLAGFAPAFSGTDPSSALQSYRLLQGLDAQGNEWIDPATHLPTRFPYSGDPLSGTGWLATIAVDYRMTVSVGPFFLAPGDSATFTFAFVAGQGLNRFDSIRRLACAATAARQAFSRDFVPPFPAPAEDCTFAAACPVPAATWAGFCADSTATPPSPLYFLSSLVFPQTRSIEAAPPYTDTFCSIVSVADPASPRARAEREHLALLANLTAPALSPGFVSPQGTPVGLSGEGAVSCPWSGPTTVARLAERAPETTAMVATYVRTDFEPRDFQPVDWGGEGYGGSIGFGASFFGSSLDPVADRDSFPAVEIHFDPSSTVRAYRYLRLEQADGSAPAGGREYRYGGYRPVPLVAIDDGTGERLELAFVERAVADAAGTLLDASAQPATFDSTWAPNADGIGSREYLFVLRRGDAGVPRPAMEVDGAIVDPFAPPPVLYAAWLNRFAEGDEPEPGEYLSIVPFVTPDSPGSDARLLALASQPQDDPAVLAAYDEIANCLAAINAGIGLGLECDITTPIALSLEESTVEGGVVRLAWYVGGEDAGPFDLARRRDDGEDWSVLARLSVDGTRRVRYEDRAVAAGERWTYGLFDAHQPGTPLDQVSVVLPGGAALALRVAPGGGGDPARLHFVLPARGEAHLELYDASGRRRSAQALGILDAGPHVRPLPGEGTAPGLYFARLTFAGRSVVAKAVALR
jgi:hypothetical protein